MSALWRSLTDIDLEQISNGNFVLPVADANTAISAFGENVVAQILPQTAWRFDYGVINSRFATTTTANGGTVTASNSHAVLQTSTAVNGSASLSSVRRLRYLNGFGGKVRFVALFDTPKADTVQYQGLGDTQNGFFIGYNGLNFGAMRRAGGVDTWVYSTAFNGDDVTSLDTTKGNVYQIQFTYLGYGPIRFSVLTDGGYAEFSTLHTIYYQNANTSTSINNPTLPLYAYIANTGNATNMTMRTPSALGGSEGHYEQPSNPLDVYNSADAQATIATAIQTHILSIRNKTSVNSITNQVPIVINNIFLGRATAGATLSTFKLYKVATFAGALTFADIDGNNSPIEFSTTSTTYSTGNPIYSIPLAGGNIAIDLKDGQIVLQPNEYLYATITNSGVQSTDVSIAFNWRELF